MKAWQFSKPKGPGYGISKNYYLSVLCARAQMPSMLHVLNPQGEGGAVVGLGVPLGQGKTKDDLTRSLERGVYALATKDRKTVLRMMVLSKEEAGFDPEPVINSRLAFEMKPEAALRLRATWTLAQLTFESHDPDVYPAVRFLLEIASRMAFLTDGVVADPISRRYLLPEDVIHGPIQPLDPRDVVSVQVEGSEAFTLGLQKFNLPELQLPDVGAGVEGLATEFLLGLSATVLSGQLMRAGAVVGSRQAPLDVTVGGHNLGRWEGIPVFELLPAKGASTEMALRAWKAGG